MGKKCQICRKKCKGDSLKTDKDQYFHIDCFKCKACQRPLTETGFYATKDGSYLCPSDFRSDQISSPLTIQAEQPKVHRQRDLPSPPLGSPSACAACGDQLQSGQVLLALNQSWHVWCFKCAECAAVLQGEYMAHEGKPLCLRDYNLKHGVKCYECDKFIAGKVLQAGGYKFHPTCARCSRCGNHFGDGQEMYMQGNEIWHPQCEHYKTTENLAATMASKSSTLRSRDYPKYPSQFGQHLTYMYLLPDAEQTYLKHPISHSAPQPPQFHTPMAPIKIRKSRFSMLKTGMQRLTENMERDTPRAKSPHMDNEEPIELAHYPAAHPPEPGTVPPIDRDDFPAPPFPYAVEELKRRLSTSSVENDDEDEEDFGDIQKIDDRKVKKTLEELEKYDKDSSIAHVIKQNLEESQKKQRLPLHWDPRNASRTPSAKKMPHLKFRYDTPINASPSRHENRPKPWVFWGNQTVNGRIGTLPDFHLPPSRGGTARAATLPDGYYYGSGDGLDTTISTHYSENSLSGYANYGSRGVPTTLRTSLPDMSKPVKTYTLNEIQTFNKKLPEDIDRQHLERHLPREEFEDLFGMTPIEFYKLPEWKRINLKRKHRLF